MVAEGLVLAALDVLAHERERHGLERGRGVVEETRERPNVDDEALSLFRTQSTSPLERTMAWTMAENTSSWMLAYSLTAFARDKGAVYPACSAPVSAVPLERHEDLRPINYAVGMEA